MLNELQAWLATAGLSADQITIVVRFTAALGVALLCSAVHIIAKRFLLNAVSRISRRTRGDGDDILSKKYCTGSRT